MIPFRDDNPTGTYPYVTVSIIILNGMVFAYEIALGSAVKDLIFHYGVVPSKVVFFLNHLSRDPSLITAALLPFLTSMFLHGGPIHIAGNMLYLWVFGDNVEDRLGHLRFLAFYLACGVIGGVVHVAANPVAGIPCIGASGAIAGVLGAYMITFPGARVLCIIPILFIWTVVELPALAVLGFWFVIQFFSGVVAFTAVADAGGGIAWGAHIGGFFAGMVIMRVLEKTRLSKAEAG